MLGWFKSKKTDASPATEDHGPPGEAEKVARIQQLCWMAGMSGETIAGVSESDLQDELMQYELNRFRKLQLEALNLARELSDEFYRDAALHLLIDSYMKAGYEKEAKKLFGSVTVDMIRDKIRETHPRLAANF